MKYAVLISLIFLCGCSTVGRFESPNGEVWRASIRGIGEAEMKTKDLTMKIKGKPMVEMPQLPELELPDN